MILPAKLVVLEDCRSFGSWYEEDSTDSSGACDVEGSTVGDNRNCRGGGWFAEEVGDSGSSNSNNNIDESKDVAVEGGADTPCRPREEVFAERALWLWGWRVRLTVAEAYVCSMEGGELHAEGRRSASIDCTSNNSELQQELLKLSRHGMFEYLFF